MKWLGMACALVVGLHTEKRYITHYVTYVITDWIMSFMICYITSYIGINRMYIKILIPEHQLHNGNTPFHFD